MGRHPLRSVASVLKKKLLRSSLCSLDRSADAKTLANGAAMNWPAFAAGYASITPSRHLAHVQRVDETLISGS